MKERERREEREVIVSREEVKKRLKELLDRKEPICIVIKGEWGVGKTHLVKEFFNKEPKEEKCAYISLFGKYSLEDIKSDLTLQLSKIIKYANVFGQVLENIKSVSPHLGSIGSLLSLLTSKEFKNVIVCFDEFERLSPKLEMKEVLGFISYLKENLNCRLILIVDESKIISKKGEKDNQALNKESGFEIEVYNQYKEKLVDYEITLNPSVEENLEIVVNKETDISESFKEAIRDFICSLNVKNIRILRRLVNTFRDFSFIENINEIKDDKYVKLYFYRKLILLSYIAYKYNKTTNLEKILKKVVSALNHKIFKSSKDHEKELKLDEKEIKEIIERYPILSGSGFFTIESEDIKYICEYIKHGFLAEKIKGGLHDFLIEKHKNIKHVEIANQFEELVEELRFNFGKNAEEIKEEILKLLNNKSNLEAIISSQGIISFINSLLFIQELTEQELTENEKFFVEIAKRCFKEFVDSKKQKLFLSYDTFKMRLGFVSDEDFKKYAEKILDKKIEEVRKEKIDNISCEEVVTIIKNILQTSGWDEKKEAILDSLQKEFIKNCFQNSVEFTKICIDFYRWRKRAKGSNHFGKFLATLKEAIKKLEIEETRKNYIKNLLNSE